MKDFEQAKALLDEVNAAIAGYDPVLKERARDILLDVALGIEHHPRGTNGADAAAANGESTTPAEWGFAALLRRWNPARASEKALLAAYYLSEVQQESPISSQAVNSVLKQNGLAVSNITRAIETNLNAKPPLMEQLRKLGTTQQARKQYRMTPDGVRLVRQRTGGGPAPNG